MDRVVEAGRALLDEKPRTGTELRALLADRFPGLDPAPLAYACQMRLALVQPPPRGLWGRSAQVAWTTAEAWLGRPLADRPSVDDVVFRYLAAFGPASAADVTTWCRLTGLRAVLDRLRPQLVTFRDERSRELFDLPGAPRPGADVPAPTRFLPEYDNVLLSHDDRSRFAFDPDRKALAHAWAVGWGSVLHDGLVRAMWRLEPDALVVRPAAALPQRVKASIAAEGRRLARFLGAPGADVRFDPLSP